MHAETCHADVVDREDAEALVAAAEAEVLRLVRSAPVLVAPVGARVRTVCATADPRRPRHCESVRAVAQVPLDLVVVDRRIAVLPLGADGAVVVAAPDAVAALHDLFEATWERGVGPGSAITPEEREILVLVASGLKDEVVARRLGLSLRTLRRRIARVMDVLGADTRFQAGVLAARRGWL
jgi:DNA-binding CsgD family transcriptional regulator